MKKGISLLLALVVFLFTLAPLQVSAAEEPEGIAVCEEGAGEGSARSAETIWYSRTINGVTQKRLWSITYECWLTDWIDC